MARSERPVRVVWLYAAQDDHFARDLLRFAAVIERQGLIRSWSDQSIQPGADIQREVHSAVSSADIVVLLLSADFLADQASMALVELARGLQKLRRLHIIPVLVRPAMLPTELANLRPLPRNGQPITAWKDRDEALVDVIEGLRQTADLVQSAMVESTVAPSAAPQSPSIIHHVGSAKRKTADIFQTISVPQETFVEPEQFPRLLANLDIMGSGLLVEGPSKIGKTTAVKKALVILARSDKTHEIVTELDAKLAGDRDELRRLIEPLWKGNFTGHLIVEDFHRVEDPELIKHLAYAMKALADREKPSCKVTLIGINPLGGSLTDALPDLMGRYSVVPMHRQPDMAIARLISQGESAANLRFRYSLDIMKQADGSFYVAQLLCRYMALRAGFLEVPDDVRTIEFPPTEVFGAIQDDMRRYERPLVDFAAHDEAAPPRGAGIALLWLISQSRDGYVPLQEAIYRFPALRPQLAWMQQSNLGAFFEKHPQLQSILYYNRDASVLSIEDPQLRFYLRNLDWDAFALKSGHPGVTVHPTDGPIFSQPGAGRLVGTARAIATAKGHLEAQGAGGEGAGAHETNNSADGSSTAQPSTTDICHLSDLHFGTKDQAVLWYNQLAQDLQELGCQRLDAIVVSGDVTETSSPDEYVAARDFLNRLAEEFSVPVDRLIVVPGNHDVNWPLSQDAYTFHRRDRYRQPLVQGTYIVHGSDVIEVRDDKRYGERFQHFAQFHKDLTGEDYSLDVAQQGRIDYLAESRIVIVGLNSAWEIDHHYTERAGLSSAAIADVLQRLRSIGDEIRLKIAVCHHPVEAMNGRGHLQLLAQAGFRVLLHGHIHRADNQLYQHDRVADGRRIDIVAAGTFGAPVRQWVPGYPLQYNLLRIGSQSITVETRCREEINGAFRPDARWLQGPGKDPLPRYFIKLSS